MALHIVKALVNRKLDKVESIEPDTDVERTDSQVGGVLDCDLLTDKEMTSLAGLCQGIVDVAFKGKGGGGGGGGGGGVGGQGEGSARKKTAAYMTRQSPLYHNCQLLAPDGSLLSTVDKKKVEWYLQRGLASM